MVCYERSRPQPDKTDVIQMTTTRRAKELSHVTKINVAGLTDHFSGQLKLLEVTLNAASTDKSRTSVRRRSFISALRHIGRR